MYLLALAMLVVNAAGCGPAGNEAPRANALAKDSPGPVAGTPKMSPETEWDKILAEGKREGAVVIYTVLESGIRETTRKAFKEQYGIDLELVVGRGAEILAKARVDMARDWRLSIPMGPRACAGGSQSLNEEEQKMAAPR